MPSKAPSAVLFFSTFKDEEAATVFAHSVVREQFAACVNVVGSVHSVYFWDGKVNDETETLVIGKTTATKFKALKKSIKSLHSYEVPELICVKIDDGLPAYLDWIAKSVK